MDVPTPSTSTTVANVELQRAKQPLPSNHHAWSKSFVSSKTNRPIAMDLKCNITQLSRHWRRLQISNAFFAFLLSYILMETIFLSFLGPKIATSADQATSKHPADPEHATFAIYTIFMWLVGLIFVFLFRRIWINSGLLTKKT
jgi:hypothetical protein